METPPIASPFGRPKEQNVLSGRLEWDSESGCFRLDYSTPFGAYLRTLLQACRFRPVLLLGLPAILLLLPIVYFGRITSRRVCTQIHEWGIVDLDAMSNLPKRSTWSQIKQIVECNGDVFFLKGPASCNIIPREAFCSAEEGHKFFQIVQRLHQSSGANWNEIQNMAPMP